MRWSWSPSFGAWVAASNAATQDSVNAIKEISSTIEKLSEISSAIAAAVEEQGAATQEIARNVQQTAHGTHAVSTNAADVQRGASETGTAVVAGSLRRPVAVARLEPTADRSRDVFEQCAGAVRLKPDGARRSLSSC
jgi:ABC-type transporter Mla subunit MlaD